MGRRDRWLDALGNAGVNRNDYQRKVCDNPLGSNTYISFQTEDDGIEHNHYHA